MAKSLSKFLLLLGFLSVPVLANAQAKGEDLYDAVVKNDTAQVRMLLDKGADVNYLKEQGFVKVNCLITSVVNDNVDIARMLIAHKAEVNWRDGFNSTALMYAASGGDPKLVELLLDNGADPTADDGDGNTPLQSAKNAQVKDLIQKRIDSKK
jgi:ankyrin repeat protein